MPPSSPLLIDLADPPPDLDPAALALVPEAAPAGPHRRRRVDVPLVLAAAVLALVVAWVFLPSLFSGHDPLVGVPRDRFLAPSGAHWFGTDFLGRDVFARVVHGASQTMKGAAIAIVLALVVGSLLGLVAASAGGIVEAGVMRVVDVLLALPGLLLALCIVATLGPSAGAVAIGIGVAAIAPFARLMRAEVLRVRHSEYVEAAHISGSGYWSALFRHVLPNSAGPVLSLVAVEFGAAILSIAALGFLGYGTRPPTPEWGSMVSEGRTYLATAWWLTTLPGVVIIVVVLAFNRVSRTVLARSRL
jgi:peptide/nickel transport system permease protein